MSRADKTAPIGNALLQRADKPSSRATVDPQRIAVVRLSALGDVVLAVPAVRALARRYPGSGIHWFTTGALAAVLHGLPDNVYVEPITKPTGVGDYWHFARRWRSQAFDLLLAMQASFRANLLYPLIRAPIKIGFDAPRARELHGLVINRRIPRSDCHLLEQFMAFAVTAGVTDTRVEWDLELDTGAQTRMHQTVGDRPYWLLNPCASKADRHWPVDRNIELIRRLRRECDLTTVVCSGPAADERDTAAKIAAAVPGVINLGGKTSLPELFALIAGARLLVSPDSGPVHVARAFGVPVVGLYADAHHHKSGPWQADEWTIDVHDQAVRELSHRDPATVPWDFRVHDPRAMEMISVDSVLDRMRGALNEAAPGHCSVHAAVPTAARELDVDGIHGTAHATPTPPAGKQP